MKTKPAPVPNQTYAFVVAGAVFFALLAAAGLRSAPGVLLLPWQEAFGWDRGTISLAAAIGIFLYGLVGPFAAALMMRFGVRVVISGALAMMALSCLLSASMTAPWQLIATWGVMSGVASGCVSMTLAATIVNRWFVKNRGLVTGVLTASTVAISARLRRAGPGARLAAGRADHRRRRGAHGGDRAYPDPRAPGKTGPAPLGRRR